MPVCALVEKIRVMVSNSGAQQFVRFGQFVGQAGEVWGCRRAIPRIKVAEQGGGM